MKVKIKRAWAMPNRWTFIIKPIQKLLNEEITPGIWVDPFCGKYSPAQITNDLNPQISATSHIDALKFLEQLENNIADGVILDPPYSITQAAKCYESYGKGKLDINVTNKKYWSEIRRNLARITKPGGKAICLGWNSQGIGKNNGFKITRVLLVPHGGGRNDTIVTVGIKNTEGRD